MHSLNVSAEKDVRSASYALTTTPFSWITGVPAENSVLFAITALTRFAYCGVNSWSRSQFQLEMALTPKSRRRRISNVQTARCWVSLSELRCQVRHGHLRETGLLG